MRTHRAAPGRTEPLPELLPELIASGVRPVSPTGVLGDPTGADAARGEALLRRLVDDVVAVLRSGQPGHQPGPGGATDYGPTSR